MLERLDAPARADHASRRLSRAAPTGSRHDDSPGSVTERGIPRPIAENAVLKPSLVTTTLDFFRRPPNPMNNARELDLIRGIDHDVHQLLERCQALMSAGEERPLLTLVGRKLRDQLRDVALLSDSLAALVSDGSEATTGRRPASAEAAPVVASLRGTEETSTASPAPVVRLKPRMPRGAWRRRGSGELAQLHIGVADEGVTENAVAGEGTVAASAATPAREPVFRLRKANAAEAPPAAAGALDPREGLDRLRDFFGDPKRG